MRITLGVTGGVAAYKAAELVRRLQQDGFTVQVVMTRGAREFVTPLTFASLSGQKVITDLFGDSSGGEANLESAIEHIAVAQRTDLLLVAPATADIIAKFARGIADDFLTTLYLASTAPVVVAPAMNVNMWNHAATQQNVETLRARGVKVVDPACVERIDVRTAKEMHHAVAERIADSSIAILAAAVADYRPTEHHAEKIKKGTAPLTISLEPTKDILAEVAKNKGQKIVVGFAAETDHVAENARKKLTAKNADLIVANDVTAEGAGFD